MSLCQQGNTRRAAVSLARADFGKVARLATRDGAAGARAQRQIPARKAQVDRNQDALTLHISECEQCTAAEVSA